MNKLGFIKLRKANKVVLIIIGIIIVFFILFRVVIYTETFIPGTDCKVVVSRFTHHYFGVVTNHCNYVDCKNESEFVSGKLNKKKYNALEKDLNDPNKINGDKMICHLFK